MGGGERARGKEFSNYVHLKVSHGAAEADKAKRKFLDDRLFSPASLVLTRTAEQRSRNFNISCLMVFF